MAMVLRATDRWARSRMHLSSCPGSHHQPFGTGASSTCCPFCPSLVAGSHQGFVGWANAIWNKRPCAVEWGLLGAELPFPPWLASS